ncbi:FIST signal transduction protein [Vibrio viridaestus]|uniref:FIST signal transduction protein n=1 Tax=Vibrio viridaestus TaxID=2487322 RepID=UPI001FB59FB6|nr:FIST N-terminal domain-containing protein [Vibrio viridaestus]
MDISALSTYVIYFTDNYSSEQMYSSLSKKISNIPYIGCTSCAGVMTDQGYFAAPAMGLLAISDSGISSYGTGSAEFSKFDSVCDATDFAVKQALCSAKREGEIPSLIILHSTPGKEEEIIERMDKMFGTLVPIIGGSSADTSLSGQWSVISDKAVSSNGIVVSLLFPSSAVSSGLSAGYSPTEFVGRITKCNGRSIYEIDGEPAKDIYKEWVGDHSGIQIDDEFSFENVTSYPLGRIVGDLYDQPYYKLTHPIQVKNDGALEVFANVYEGEEITLMTGHKEQLITRASRVIKEANAKNYARSLPLGAIMIFCAGAMLRLGDDINRVHENVIQQLPGKSFICPFTYGEQGRFTGGQNAHGNLMISAVIFYKSE